MLHMALYDRIRTPITLYLETFAQALGGAASVYAGDGPLVPARLLTARETGPTSGGVNFDAGKQALQSSADGGAE